MPWVTLSVTDVKERLAGAEVTALQTVALASGQTDPTASIISDVVKEVRGRLLHAGYGLENGDTIPDVLTHHTLAVIRYRLFTRLPGQSFITPQRESEYRDAMEVLDRYGPPVPDAVVTAEDQESQAGPGLPSIAARELVYTREAQDGL